MVGRCMVVEVTDILGPMPLFYVMFPLSTWVLSSHYLIIF